MPASSPLTFEQRDEFERRGLLRCPGLLPAEAVRAARQAVLSRFETLGLWRDGDWRLDGGPPPVWPDKGFSAKAIGNHLPEVVALSGDPAVLAVVGALLDGEPIDRSVYKRPQVLATLPNAPAWFLPEGWHADDMGLPRSLSPGVQLFACLDTVEPRGGGTLVMAGSHRLFGPRSISTRGVNDRLRREPFIRALAAEGACEVARQDDGGLQAAGEIDGVEVEVIELTGAPGDVVFVDLRLLHCIAPNAGDRPRLMITDRFLRADRLKPAGGP